MECLQYLVSQEERSALRYAWFLEDVARVRLRKEYVFWLSEEIGTFVKRHTDVADSAIWYADVCFPRLDASCRRRGVLACMYLALKVHHDESVSLDELIGCEIEKSEHILMEAKVLEILEWKLHPPVVSVFISQLGYLLGVKRDAIEAAHEHWRLVSARTKLLDFKSSVKACALLRHFDGKIEASTLAQMCSCSADEIAACGRVLWRKRRLDGSHAGVECSL